MSVGAALTNVVVPLIVTVSPTASPRVELPFNATAPEKLAAAAVIVPVKVGLADITTLPVPVIALLTKFLLASVKMA